MHDATCHIVPANLTVVAEEHGKAPTHTFLPRATPIRVRRFGVGLPSNEHPSSVDEKRLIILTY